MLLNHIIINTKSFIVFKIFVQPIVQRSWGRMDTATSLVCRINFAILCNYIDNHFPKTPKTVSLQTSLTQCADTSLTQYVEAQLESKRSLYLSVLWGFIFCYWFYLYFCSQEERKKDKEGKKGMESG